MRGIIEEIEKDFGEGFEVSDVKIEDNTVIIEMSESRGSVFSPDKYRFLGGNPNGNVYYSIFIDELSSIEAGLMQRSIMFRKPSETTTIADELLKIGKYRFKTRELRMNMFYNEIDGLTIELVDKSNNLPNENRFSIDELSEELFLHKDKIENVVDDFCGRHDYDIFIERVEHQEYNVAVETDY